MSSRGNKRGRKIVTFQSTYGTVQLFMTHLNLNMLTEQRSLHIWCPSLFESPLESFSRKRWHFPLFTVTRAWKAGSGVNASAQSRIALMQYRASVQTILFSWWSRVSPLGQAPVSMSLNTMCRPTPLMDAASMRGNVASQSVQKRILRSDKSHSFFFFFLRKLCKLLFRIPPRETVGFRGCNHHEATFIVTVH